MERGRKYVAKCDENSLENRTRRLKPGNTCTLVYTSGTTGPPKGVMLSHDNYTWPAQITMNKYDGHIPPKRIISYLPLSHVAAQVIDIVGSMYTGSNVFFAGPDAL
jgi:long-chain-fatty-acid--CoA ligase ACSBG